MTNSLDNLTILRFTHSFKSGGGVEQHLRVLDDILLKRNRTRIIRLYFDKGFRSWASVVTNTGRGTLIEIPLPVSIREVPVSTDSPQQPQQLPLIELLKRKIFEKIFDLMLYTPLYRSFLRARVNVNAFYRGLYEFINAGKYARRILQEYKVDLLVMHHVGTMDSLEMIAEAKTFGVPYIFINHFANRQFKNIAFREQLMDASAIAGVSDVDVPFGLRINFHHVSSGLDLDFFDPDNAHRLDIDADVPIIIYPARITEEKGQIDLIETCTELKRRNIRTKLVFAGRTDSVAYELLLRQRVNENMLMDDVFFLGELTQERLRDWYGIASLLAFPTHVAEGLPRILMEAQAMKVPPIVYNVGGIPNALIHGKTGILVPKGNRAELTRQIEYLLANEDIRKTMGENGRAFIQRNFGLDALAIRHEKLYLSALT